MRQKRLETNSVAMPFVAAALAFVLLLGLGSGVAWAYLTATGSGTGTVTIQPTVTTTSLNPPNSTTLGSETSESFTGSVTGVSDHGSPKGRLKVVTSTGATLCTTTLTPPGVGYVSTFTCTMTTPTLLIANTYSVSAQYEGGKSATPDYLYDASTSTPQTLTVNN